MSVSDGSGQVYDETLREDAENVSRIEASLTGVRDSRVDSIGTIEADKAGIDDASIGEVDRILSGKAGVRDSEVDRIGGIDSEGHGIRNSDIGSVESIKSQKDGITQAWGKDDSGSNVDEVGEISARYGIKGSEVGSVDSIEAERIGISDSEVGHIGVLNSEGRGIIDSEVGSVDGIEVDRRAMSDSEVGTLGDVKAGSTVAAGSEIDTVKGDLVSEGVIFNNTDVKEIYGDLIAQDFMDVEGFFEDPRENSRPSLGSLTDRNKWFGGEKEIRGDIFNSTDLPYVVADQIKGKHLDRRSYGGFIAADDVDVETFNENMFVVTPDSSDEFTDYNGDWGELKEFLKDRDEVLKGLSVFTPDVDEIEDIDHLMELEQQYSDIVDEFDFSEIRDNLRYVHEFNDINEQHFSQMLTKAIDTMETAEKENVKEFGEIFSKLPGDIQDQMLESLESRKDSTVGYDLFNIGKKRKYSEFIEGEEYELVKLMDGGNSVIEGLESLSEPASSFENENLRGGLVEMFQDGKIPEGLGDWLKDRYLSMRDGRLEGLMQRFAGEDYGDLPEIDEDAFEEDSPYREILEDVMDEFDSEIEFLTYMADAAGQEYDPDYGLKSKEGRRQHDPNFDPEEDEDFESLWEHVKSEAEKDIENKERSYLMDAVKGLGKKIAREEYEKAVGDVEEKEEFSDDEIAALHAHSRYGRNRNVVEKILDSEVEPEGLEENSEWLEDNGFEYDDIAGFDEVTYDVEASQSLETTIEEKREELLDEMQDLINELGDYEVDSVEDIERKQEEIERPSGEKQEVYDELFKEKIDEYRGIEEQIGGVPDRVTVRPAEPLEAMQMGSHFTNSCLAIGKGNGWSAAANAMDANKQVLYAEDEDGEVVGRLLTAVTDDGRLEDFKVYNNSEADIGEQMDDYVEQYADHLGLERVPEDEEAKNVESLVAEDWYSSAIY